MYRLVMARDTPLGGGSGRSLTTLSDLDRSVRETFTYLLSAAGTGAAGGVLLVSSLRVRPDTVFGVQWSAYMIFIVIIGGLGYLEGPLIGSLIVSARGARLFGVGYRLEQPRSGP